ncbi:hypothetical protein V6N11_001173 [Hibiscus sabdariffa]|uniref:Uncharacterized protein n=1 Tax=Hibiscus sabdariffa TaxID=183260 RepID=A0ABR2RZ85_9ROSI
MFPRLFESSGNIYLWKSPSPEELSPELSNMEEIIRGASKCRHECSLKEDEGHDGYYPDEDDTVRGVILRKMKVVRGIDLRNMISFVPL